VTTLSQTMRRPSGMRHSLNEPAINPNPDVESSL
jgi:hypothetical protein